jgi:hypothetical protein
MHPEVARLLAAPPRSGGVHDVAYALALVMAYLVPLYLGYRIGTRKGYTTFRWLLPVVVFSWLGVLFLALMPRTGSATVQTPSEYHVPGKGTPKPEVTEWLYGRRRR